MLADTLVGCSCSGCSLLGREIHEVVVCAVEVDLGCLLGLELLGVQSNHSIQVSVHCLLLVAVGRYDSGLGAHGGLYGCTASTYSCS